MVGGQDPKFLLTSQPALGSEICPVFCNLYFLNEVSFTSLSVAGMSSLGAWGSYSHPWITSLEAGPVLCMSTHLLLGTHSVLGSLRLFWGPTLQELVLGSDWVTLSPVGGAGAEQRAELPAAFGLIATRPTPPSPSPFSQGIPQGLHSFWRPSLSLMLLPFLPTPYIWFVTAFQRSVLPVGICHQKARLCGTVGPCLWKVSAWRLHPFPKVEKCIEGVEMGRGRLG